MIDAPLCSGKELLLSKWRIAPYAVKRRNCTFWPGHFALSALTNLRATISDRWRRHPMPLRLICGCDHMLRVIGIDVPFMRCDKCLKLWSEYGIAVRLAREPAVPETARTRKAILDEIETHEAEGHHEISAAASA